MSKPSRPTSDTPPPLRPRTPSPVKGLPEPKPLSKEWFKETVNPPTTGKDKDGRGTNDVGVGRIAKGIAEIPTYVKNNPVKGSLAIAATVLVAGGLIAATVASGGLVLAAGAAGAAVTVAVGTGAMAAAAHRETKEAANTAQLRGIKNRVNNAQSAPQQQKSQAVSSPTQDKGKDTQTQESKNNGKADKMRQSLRINSASNVKITSPPSTPKVAQTNSRGSIQIS